MADRPSTPPPGTPTGPSVDAFILRSLRASGDAAISGADLAQQLGISRAAVWARIDSLRTLGYDISASPHQGYRILNSPDLLHADDLLARLGPTRVVGRDIRVFQETASTNDIADRLARDGAPEGAAIFAESQTHGRGRLGRRWFSPPNSGLWVSILLRPKLHPSAVTRLTLAAATATARAIEKETGISPDIKWPNDLLIRGKKTAGILTELSAEMDGIKYVILGIGIDVNLPTSHLPPELRPIATSLSAEACRPVNRPALAASLLRELDQDYHRLDDTAFEGIVSEWQDRCTTLGQRIRITNGPRILEGVAESIDSEGALLLRTHHGRLERILGGDVSVLKP